MKTGIKMFGRTTIKINMAKANAPPNDPTGGREYAIAKLIANTAPVMKRAAVPARGRAKYRGILRYLSTKLILSYKA